MFSASDPSFRAPLELTLRSYMQRILSRYMGKSYHTNTHNLEHAWYSFHLYMCEDIMGDASSLIVHPQFKIVLDRDQGVDETQDKSVEHRKHRRESGATSGVAYDHFIPDFAIIYIPYEFHDVLKEFIWFEGLSIPILIESKRPVSRKLDAKTFVAKLLMRLEDAYDSLLRYAQAIFELFPYQHYVLCIAAVGCHWTLFIVHRDSPRVNAPLMGDNRLADDDESDEVEEGDGGNDPKDADYIPSNELNKNKKRSLTISDAKSIPKKRARHNVLPKVAAPDEILNSAAFVQADGFSSEKADKMFISSVKTEEPTGIFQYGTSTSNTMMHRIQIYLKSDGEAWINYREETEVRQDETRPNND